MMQPDFFGSSFGGGGMKNKKRSALKVRYAVVGLGHLAQVAILPAFLPVIAAPGPWT
jgi:hypothetical protein